MAFCLHYITALLCDATFSVLWSLSGSPSTSPPVMYSTVRFSHIHSTDLHCVSADCGADVTLLHHVFLLTWNTMDIRPRQTQWDLWEVQLVALQQVCFDDCGYLIFKTWKEKPDISFWFLWVRSLKSWVFFSQSEFLISIYNFMLVAVTTFLLLSLSEFLLTFISLLTLVIFS